MYQGRHLIIAANGKALMGARSCDVNIQAEVVPTSSPLTGAWATGIPGKKSWSVSTNQLLPARVPSNGILFGRAVPHNGLGKNEPSVIVTPNGVSYPVAQRGFSFLSLPIYPPYQPISPVVINWDTYGDTEEEGQDEIDRMEEYFANVTDNSFMGILVSHDAYGMTESLRTTLENAFDVDLSAVATGRHRDALVIIGGYNENVLFGSGSVAYRPEYLIYGSPAETRLVMTGVNNSSGTLTGIANPATVMKSSASYVGNIYTLDFGILGYTQDHLAGRAICKQFRVTGTVGNLIQGSFQFEGVGPLE